MYIYIYNYFLIDFQDQSYYNNNETKNKEKHQATNMHKK